MDPLVIVLLSVTALIAGTVDAIAGGGGLVTLPALLLAGLPPHLALGTNKGGSVWGSGAALIAFWRARRVDRWQACFTFPLGFLGSLIGAMVVFLIAKTKPFRQFANASSLSTNSPSQSWNTIVIWAN